MSPNIFVTGVTGYIGGDAITTIIEKHPDWQVTCLVRNSDKGSKVAAAFASVRLVYGDLDSVDLIEEEASKADIVYHFADCDHEASAHAIAKGLARRSGPSTGFWIHTSGSMVIGWEGLEKGIFGDATPKVYNDWDGINELTTIPDTAPHRNVDKIVIGTSASHTNIKTAIVCPPTIYGTGNGPDNQRSMQAYKAAEHVLQSKKGFQIGNGQNIWHQIHVHDLSRLYLLLGEAAAAGGDPATWNTQGYYLAENGEFAWGTILHEIAKVAHKKGLIPSEEVQSLSVEEVATVIPGQHRAHISVGSNSRGVSIRAKKLLGWTPTEKSLMDTVPDIVDYEAKRLDLMRGHAATVEEDQQS